MAAAPIPDPVGNAIPGGLIAGTIVQYTIKKFPNLVFVGTIVKNGAVPQDGPQATRIARTPNGSNQQDYIDGDERRGFYHIQHAANVKLFAAIRLKGPPTARIPGVTISALPLTIDPVTFQALITAGNPAAVAAAAAAAAVPPGAPGLSAPLLVPGGAAAAAAPLAPGGGVAAAAPLAPGGGVAAAPPPLVPLFAPLGLNARAAEFQPAAPAHVHGPECAGGCSNASFTGGYYEKYLKYKAKYLDLKNQI